MFNEIHIAKRIVCGRRGGGALGGCFRVYIKCGAYRFPKTYIEMDRSNIYIYIVKHRHTILEGSLGMSWMQTQPLFTLCVVNVIEIEWNKWRWCCDQHCAFPGVVLEVTLRCSSPFLLLHWFDCGNVISARNKAITIVHQKTVFSSQIQRNRTSI